MIRNFFIGMSFLGILFLAFYTLYDKKKESIFSLNTCQPLTCDLNLQDCVFSFNKKNIEVSAYPKPIKIKNFPHYSNLKIKIYSLNSYIGDIIPKFNIVNGDILINFIGRSITDDSRFRVEFLNNNAPTGFFFDFDVTMQKNFQTGNTH
ncbi:hypothetical protein [Campylobacter jejuni]|uniref:hypothetical protein n=1 Tax=Campylobacter jejuni TaxID=197 RepID=UPI001801F0A5|nr:hypothetical protein [Campylobacter jejuni]EAI1982956.1 hypothetical protein [Campylobacter jejuni]HEF5905848.1 hypothetical protein [Campylobacter jejuni]HEF5911105.1 hypothetical protein [Campylobacter jejuni]